MKVTSSTNLKLSNGVEMPIHGLGTWLSKPGEVEAAVETALDAGYRLIDTAQVYGNEGEIGKVLTKRLASGALKRDDVFVTTKNWVTYFRREEVTESLKLSLGLLGLDKVDLYLLHAPCAAKRQKDSVQFEVEDGAAVPLEVDLRETWKGMEDVYKAGLARAIGLSNFSAAQIRYVCEGAAVQPHNLQVELHVYWPQEELRRLCEEKAIALTSYATLGSPGRLAVKGGGGRVIEWPDPGVPMEDAVVVEVAERLGKTTAQVLLRWAMQSGVAVIPKSVTPDRIRQNIDLWDFELSDDDVDKLSHLAIRQRLFLQDWAKRHPQDPFKDERKPAA